MIDLGFAHIPLEAINVIVIVTAILLAVRYIGFDIFAAISGLTAVIYGGRIMLHKYEVVIAGHTLGPYEAALLVIVGAFLLYRGTESFLSGEDINTWK